MGHDIWAYKIANNKVAAYRRNAFTPNNSLIYKALNCMDLYAGVSGNGESRVFSDNQIEKAIEFIGDNEKERDTIEFLKECLKNCNEN